MHPDVYLHIYRHEVERIEQRLEQRRSIEQRLGSRPHRVGHVLPAALTRHRRRTTHG